MKKFQENMLLRDARCMQLQNMQCSEAKHPEYGERLLKPVIMYNSQHL